MRCVDGQCKDSVSESPITFCRPPQLGPIDVRPVESEGRRLFLAFDPTGLHTNAIVLSPEALPLLGFIDGKRDAEGIRAAYAVHGGGTVSGKEMESFLDTLARAGLLEGPGLDKMRQDGNERYRAAGKRTPVLAGEAYPAEPDDLRRTLDEWFEMPDTPSPSGLEGVVLPHIDFRRAPFCYGTAAAALRANPADFYVMLGTGHNLARSDISVSSMSYETPLGVVESDEGAVHLLAEVLGEEVFAEEYGHAREHSLEFASVVLRCALDGGRTAKGVFVLLGSLFPGNEFNGTSYDRMNALAEILGRMVFERRSADQKVILIAAADLSHVGARFGDKGITPQEDLSWLEKEDRAALGVFADDGAEAFLEIFKKNNNARNVCGISAMYVLRRVLAGAHVEDVVYEQSPEPETLSVVTMGAVLLR